MKLVILALKIYPVKHPLYLACWEHSCWVWWIAMHLWTWRNRSQWLLSSGILGFTLNLEGMWLQNESMKWVHTCFNYTYTYIYIYTCHVECRFTSCKVCACGVCPYIYIYVYIHHCIPHHMIFLWSPYLNSMCAGQQMRAESEGALGHGGIYTNWRPVNNMQHPSHCYCNWSLITIVVL